MAEAGRLRVLVSDEQGRAVAVRGLATWLARVAPRNARGVVSVALVSDARVRELNREYRSKDYPTDVLSFPADEAPQHRTRRSIRSSRKTPSSPKSPSSPTSLQPPASPQPSASPQSPAPSPFLGDIVIARGVAKRQSRAAGHLEGTELRILALHGLLHLLGYDHEQDNGTMLRVERRLRLKGGLRESLIERAHRTRPAGSAP
jgi:probable rRNA maturation factor